MDGRRRGHGAPDLNTFASIYDVRTEVDASGNNIWNSLDPFWQQRILSHVGESLIFQAPKSDKTISPRGSASPGTSSVTARPRSAAASPGRRT